MPDQLQLRGGTTTEHNSFTGAAREVTVDTTKKTLVVHDGSQAGGTPLMKESGATAASSVQIGTGGVERLKLEAAGVVFNETGADVDFRIEGDTQANLFYVDAGNDRVGIGRSDPQTTFHSTGTTNGQQATFGASSTGLKISTFAKTDNDAGVILDAQQSSNGTLTFATTGSERVRIDSSGRVLLATTSASGADSSADDLVIGNTSQGNNGMTIVTNNANNGVLFFADQDASVQGGIRYQHGADLAQFYAGGNVVLNLKNKGVGINETSPTEDGLTIRGADTNDTPLLILKRHSDGDTTTGEVLGKIQFVSNENNVDSGNPHPRVALHAVQVNNAGAAKLEFYTVPNFTTDAVKTMTLNQEGRLCIGTDDAVAKLNVVHSTSDTSATGSGTLAGCISVSNTNTTTNNFAGIVFGDRTDSQDFMGGIFTILHDHTNNYGSLVFYTNGAGGRTEKMRITNNNQVLINTTSGGGRLTVNNNTGGHYTPSGLGGVAQNGIHVHGNHGNSGERGGAISFSAGGTGAAAIAARNESTDRDQIGLEFFTHNNSDEAQPANRRLRMSIGGYFYFGAQEINDPANNNSVGISLSDNLGFLSVCRDSDVPMVVGVKGSDFQLIRFLAQGSQEGNISVSGSTVSYNGGHLSRWSQIKGISTTDKSARPTIYQGTVMSNLDDLCVWSYPDQFYTEQDKADDQIPEGKNVGDLKKAAHTEENQQLNMTKISDTEADKDVAGVFWTWDNSNDDYYVNDYYVAMTGDMVIRVAGSTTVARGDLMISAGDGTAKPQADDIIRSSTIAKIISTNHTATYADGSKAYPCVLMAC